MIDLLKQRRTERRIGQTEVIERPGVASTYTPTYLGLTTAGTTTYSLQSGNWVRLGPIVIASGIVIWTAATGTGNAIISLPFTSDATYGDARGSLWTDSVTIGAFTPYALLNANNAYFRLFTPANNAASTAIAVEAAGDIRFTIAYRIG